MRRYLLLVFPVALLAIPSSSIAQTEVGSNDVRISDMAGDGNTSFDAVEAANAYSATSDVYLVVWEGEDDAGGLVDNEVEIFGQLVTGTGTETGTNDFRISFQGGTGNSTFDALDPEVAWNSVDDEFLVVWSGDRVAGEDEIYGQRVSTAGVLLGSAFQISDMGSDGDTNFDALDPDVAFNATDAEYLVVWEADDVTNGELEIYGQRLSATGAEVGSNDFRVSTMGTDGDTSFDALNASVAYNSTDNQFLVVWSGDRIPGEDEIYAQRLDNAGGDLGTDSQISFQGPNDDTAYDAEQPDIAYNVVSNEYLVVWRGDRINGEDEIYGQRLTFAGSQTGSVFRISDMGPEGGATYDAIEPAVEYDSGSEEYIVVFRGDDDTGGLVDNEFEIYLQRIDAATGTQTGTNDFRISDMGPDGVTSYAADAPSLAYNSTSGELLVVWDSDDDEGGVVDGETEIYMQRVLVSSLLAVEFARFEALQLGDDVILAWETVSESNNAGFEIEHRQASGWRTVGFVEGSGTSSAAILYSFRMGGLRPGLHRFRLRQLDYDGSNSYSAVVELTISSPNYTVSPVFPHPVRQQADFTVSTVSPGHLKSTLHDILGREIVVLFDDAVAASTLTTIALDGTDLAPGLYMIYTVGPGFRHSRKMIVAK